MKTHRARRASILGAVAVAATLALGSVAWACTVPEGATFFTDGRVSKTVMRGARLSAYATSAPRNVGLKLVIGSNGPHPTHACMVTNYTVNNTVRFADSSGFIAPTAGPAGDAGLPKGVWQVCFTDYQFKNVSTSAATLTVI